MRRFLLPVFLGLAACSTGPGRPFVTENDFNDIEAVMMRDFHARGSAKMDRIAPDDLQKACNLADNAP